MALIKHHDVAASEVNTDYTRLLEGFARGREWCCGASRRDADTWREIWTVQATDRNPDDLFGISVSLSNDQLVVGAPGSRVVILMEHSARNGSAKILKNCSACLF